MFSCNNNFHSVLKNIYVFFKNLKKCKEAKYDLEKVLIPDSNMSRPIEKLSHFVRRNGSKSNNKGTDSTFTLISI